MRALVMVLTSEGMAKTPMGAQLVPASYKAMGSPLLRFFGFLSRHVSSH